jgi:hypothetical protein
VTILAVQFTVREDNRVEVKSALENMTRAIQREHPAGVRFASCRFPDGLTFLNVLQLDDGVDNPMPGIEECRSFQQSRPKWAVGPAPTPQSVSAIGSYDLL